MLTYSVLMELASQRNAEIAEAAARAPHAEAVPATVTRRVAAPDRTRVATRLRAGVRGMSVPVRARSDRVANRTTARSVWPGTALSGDATEGDAAMPAGSGRLSGTSHLEELHR